MTFTAIVTSHGNEPGLRSILGQLRYQTRPPDETLAFCSDTNDFLRLTEDFPDVRFFREDDMGDWGHQKRSRGLEEASGDWVGFFNDDDSYDPRYLEKLLAETGAADVVYCDWNTHPGCVFALASSTSGNFIVRTAVARQAGYTDRVYEADGLFIERVRPLARVAKVHEVLYRRNQQ